ncbi:isoleucine N-monooxygenase 2-like isoform X2 [Papaver somniferum]|uniref:isoleucine N-monooxygenase 2-like isoform X2 n=1 Tax=Papaver somniferum TaxID=3469 RepID=UPI000E6FC261|nr:isoleucine N-monooxygenase 2-like isoform X2 [Papaver somniferum]
MANKTSFLTFFNTTLWLDPASTLAIVELDTSYLPTILASIVVLLLIKFGVNTLKKQPSLSASFPLPPGPSPWPILGSIPALVRNKPRYKWILGLMKEMNTVIACIRLGNVHIIPVTSPELAREFLQKQDAVFASRPRTMATEHLSRGFLTTIVTPWGDQWKKMRRVVTSEMVSHARLEWLLGKRNEEANNLVFYVHSQCNKNSLIGGEVINLRLLTRQFSGNIIRKMIFNNRYFGKGRKDGRPGIEEIEHVDAAFEVLIYVYAFGIQDYLPCLRWLDLDGHEKIIKRAMGVVNKYHDPIIEERIRQRSNGTTKNKVPEDLLDVLISLKDEKGKPLLSVEEIKAQVVLDMKEKPGKHQTTGKKQKFGHFGFYD